MNTKTHLKVVLILLLALLFSAVMPAAAQSSICNDILEFSRTIPTGANTTNSEFGLTAGSSALIKATPFGEVIFLRLDIVNVDTGETVFSSVYDAAITFTFTAPSTITIRVTVTTVAADGVTPTNLTTGVVDVLIYRLGECPPFEDQRLVDWSPIGIVYANVDGIFVYTLNENSQGVLIAYVSAADLAKLPAKPSSTLLIAASADGRAGIFKFSDGRYEVQVGADFEGKVRAISFEGLPPTNITQREFFSDPTARVADPADVVITNGTTRPVSTTPAEEETTVDTSEPVLTGEGFLIVNTDNLNLRSGPGAQYTSVGVVDGGTRLNVLGRNSRRSWWYVETGGLKGWVNGIHAFVRGDLTNVPVVETVGELIQPSFVPGFDGNLLYADVGELNPAVCTLTGGAEYTIIGRSAGGNWYQLQVNCNGTVVIGWIQSSRGVVRNPADLDIPITYR